MAGNVVNLPEFGGKIVGIRVLVLMKLGFFERREGGVSFFGLGSGDFILVMVSDVIHWMDTWRG